MRKAISRGLYYANEEFESLPEEAKKVVVRPEQLKEWAQMPSEEIDTVVRSNFRRSYEIMLKRSAELESLPKEVKKLVGAVNKKQIEAKM